MFYQILSDTVKSLLTKRLQPIQELHEQFYLAGGTALALQLGHRKSDDLDFFSEREFESEQIIQAVMKLGGRIDSQSSGTLHTSIGGSKVSYPRDDRIRIISARKASRKERRIYEENST